MLSLTGVGLAIGLIGGFAVGYETEAAAREKAKVKKREKEEAKKKAEWERQKAEEARLRMEEEKRKEEEFSTLEELSEMVMAFSINYKGIIDIDIRQPQEKIVTDYFTERKTAEIYLKGTSALKGYNIVYNVEFISEIRSNGNYVYKVWMAKGNAAYRKYRH
ncbi:hypothetical protein DCCM_1977 [Desulfocucumis palustris]|uniref:Uncharacterized protein n=1 Tax=Desulfocucumis palustris TaxID=1898651 RepID=A0A2L2X9Z1_9FIRM|nr:hypothetical protein DCCM_1977 [Desulfocucumis palustris]